jgi:hypothetical protein
MWRVGAVLLMAGSMAACTDSQEAPPLAGPSTTAQSVTLSASPDMLPHNGSAQSVVTISMHDEGGQPLAGQRLALGASTGTLSQFDVVTGSDGRAVVIATAPALSTPAAKITVSATPFGTNAENALTRTLTIVLTGTLNATAPTASFTFLPEAPVEGASDTIVFDASATTDEGQACGDRCSYAWNFGNLGAGDTGGMVVTRSAVTKGAYAVTLTVTDDAGTVASTTRVVTVAPPAAPTP